MAQDVKNLHGATSVYGWYLFDEPDLNQVPHDEYGRLAKRLRRLDRDRPIFLTVWSPDRYREYVEDCDIFAPNPYPIRHVEPELNDLRSVGETVEAARAAAGSKPVWA